MLTDNKITEKKEIPNQSKTREITTKKGREQPESVRESEYERGERSSIEIETLEKLRLIVDRGGKRNFLWKSVHSNGVI